MSIFPTNRQEVVISKDIDHFFSFNDGSAAFFYKVMLVEHDIYFSVTAGYWGGKRALRVCLLTELNNVELFDAAYREIESELKSWCVDIVITDVEHENSAANAFFQEANGWQLERQENYVHVPKNYMERVEKLNKFLGPHKKYLNQRRFEAFKLEKQFIDEANQFFVGTLGEPTLTLKHYSVEHSLALRQEGKNDNKIVAALVLQIHDNKLIIHNWAISDSFRKSRIILNLLSHLVKVIEVTKPEIVEYSHFSSNDEMNKILNRVSKKSNQLKSMAIKHINVES